MIRIVNNIFVGLQLNILTVINSNIKPKLASGELKTASDEFLDTQRIEGRTMNTAVTNVKCGARTLPLLL